MSALAAGGAQPSPASLTRAQISALTPFDVVRPEVSGASVKDATVQRGVMAWATVIGVVSWEVSGHFGQGLVDGPAFFDGVVEPSPPIWAFSD